MAIAEYVTKVLQYVLKLEILLTIAIEKIKDSIILIGEKDEYEALREKSFMKKWIVKKKTWK